MNPMVPVALIALRLVVASLGARRVDQALAMPSGHERTWTLCGGAVLLVGSLFAV